MNLVIKSLSMWYRGNISSRFSCNSEADASELQENLEDMLPWYYMHSNMVNILNYRLAYVKGIIHLFIVAILMYSRRVTHYCVVDDLNLLKTFIIRLIYYSEANPSDIFPLKYSFSLSNSSIYFPLLNSISFVKKSAI